MADNVQVIRNFIEAWSRLDAGELAGFFAEDGVYHNMPVGPVSGRAAVREFIANFIKDWTSTHWEIVTIAEAGNKVIAERVDRTSAGDVSVDLPCCGVFEMEDGRIKVWRDYFDLATYMKPFQA